MPKFVDLVLAHATRDFDQPYSYRVPEGMQLELGMLVAVPFGRGVRLRPAYVLGFREAIQGSFEIKEVAEVLSPSVLRADQLDLAKELRRRLACSMAEALAVMAPPAVHRLGHAKQRWIRLVDPEQAEALLAEGSLRSLGQVRALGFLLDCQEAPLDELFSASQCKRHVVAALRKKGLAVTYTREIPRATTPLTPRDEAKILHLHADQERALKEILAMRPAEAPNGLAEALLLGVTGSGKTEVYLRAAEQVLAEGKSCILLVPEISLTPLLCGRIADRFGDRAAVLHSRLTPGERYEQWRQIRQGEKHLVAGARSAIFAPLESIGLIVIDEEQEGAYKSERSPRYDAREVARLRAIQHGARLVLASATPAIETRARCEQGKSILLRLPQRAAAEKPVQSQVIDMRQERVAGNKEPVSRALKAAMAACFEAGEQAMIFLNRRGLFSYRLCRDCGSLHYCRHCDLAMKEHKNLYAQGRGAKQLICHSCGLIQAVPERCPSCDSERFLPFGVGTQQIEEWFVEHFPAQRCLRMDQDSTGTQDAHAKILAAFEAGEADCLIGTQMIAKGHDFKDLRLVGILAADMLLAMDDFRAEERSFQLLCQAAGRAGRHEKAGEVLVQAFQPQHPVIREALTQDYEGFYLRMMERRRLLAFPPFVHLGLLLLQGPEEAAVRRAAQDLEKRLKRMVLQEKIPVQELQVFAAHPAPLARLRQRWRFRILVKAQRGAHLSALFGKAMDLPMPKNIRLQVDINPLSML